MVLNYLKEILFQNNHNNNYKSKLMIPKVKIKVINNLIQILINSKQKTYKKMIYFKIKMIFKENILKFKFLIHLHNKIKVIVYIIQIYENNLSQV